MKVTLLKVQTRMEKSRNPDSIRKIFIEAILHLFPSNISINALLHLFPGNFDPPVQPFPVLILILQWGDPWPKPPKMRDVKKVEQFFDTCDFLYWWGIFCFWPYCKMNKMWIPYLVTLRKAALSSIWKMYKVWFMFII